MSRLAGLPIPEEGERRGRRARFSSHTITEAELSALDGCLTDQEKRLKTVSPAIKRALLRYVFAA
jgi:hypothetical protein